MFTGIIETIGTIQSVQHGTDSSQLIITADTEFVASLHHGDSVATDGVCLTVAHLYRDSFAADVMAQTLRHSTLGNLKRGDQVNLERALQLSSRLGGHLLSGHVDTQGYITQIRQEGIARWVTIGVPHDYMRYVIDRGAVAIDGISLTVADLGDDSLSVSTIPVTQGDTTLSAKRVGDRVNLEFDMIAKYTERLLMHRNDNKSESAIGMAFLAENGFL